MIAQPFIPRMPKQYRGLGALNANLLYVVTKMSAAPTVLFGALL